MTQAEFDEASMKALSLFEFGQVSYNSCLFFLVQKTPLSKAIEYNGFGNLMIADHKKSNSLFILLASILKCCALLEGLLDSKHIMLSSAGRQGAWTDTGGHKI